jgi:hypothetical protein
MNGCAPSVGQFAAEVPSSPENSVLYIYRPEPTQPGLMKPLRFDYPEVLVDGASIGVLRYDEYLAVELTPGPHTLTVTGLTAASSGWAARDIVRDLPANRDKQVFMKLRVEYDTREMTIDQLSPKYTIQLTPVDADDAIYEIRNTSPSGD